MTTAPRPSASAILAFVLACVTAAPASAAMLTGPLASAEPWWLGPGGTIGAVVSADGDTLWVDTDGNGLIQPGSDTWYQFPAELEGAQLRLTPSREFLYAFRGAQTGDPGGCDPETDAMVFFHRLSGVAGALPAPVATQCIPGGIAHQGFYDRPATSCLRVAYVAGREEDGTQRAYFFDLENGTVGGGGFTYASTIGFVQFAPSGNVALVQHALGGQPGAEYTALDLCPDGFGQRLNLAPLSADGGAVTGEITVRGGTEFVLRLYHPDFGGGSYDLPQSGSLEDCTCDASGGTGGCCLPDGSCADGLTAEECADQGGTWQGPDTDCAGSDCPPVIELGACCLPDGSCVDGTEAGACEDFGGTWQGADTFCADIDCPLPPAVEFHIAKIGPDGVMAGEIYPYVIEYGNEGELGAADVSVTDRVPSGTTFRRASGNGDLDATSGEVVWAVGELVPGAAAQETLYVEAGCLAETVSNDFYFITGTPGGDVFGDAVHTAVTPASEAAVDLSAGAVPDSEPLDTGDEITHTVTLTNTVTVRRPGITFATALGRVSSLGEVLDDGGGLVSATDDSLTWVGELEPGGTVVVVFTTVLDECRPDDVATESLNRGAPIAVANPCGAEVGLSAAPPAFSVVPPPLNASVEAANLAPPRTIGGGDVPPVEVVLARRNEVIEFEAVVENVSDAALATVTATIDLGFDLLADGDPPFIGTPPAGTSWDPASRVITWSGALPAQETAVFRFGARVPLWLCEADVEVRCGAGSCTDNVRAEREVDAIPTPPAGGWVVGLAQFDGLWHFDPGSFVPSVQPMFCLEGEQYGGLGLGENGDIWVVGRPTYRLNPYTLQITGFGGRFHATSTDRVEDAAVDPADGSVLMVGSLAVPGQGTATLWRYHPETEQIDVLLDDTAPTAAAAHVLLDLEGMIVADGDTTVLRIDPASPTSFQAFADTLVPRPWSLALDEAGDYLVSGWVVGQDEPRVLARIDRTTGAFSVVVEDLNDLVPTFSPYAGSALGDLGQFYLGPENAEEMHRINLEGMSPPASFASPFYGTKDVLFVPEGTATAIAPPDDPDAPPAGSLPRAAALESIHPNPFNPRTEIAFSVPRAEHVRLAVYDVRGRRVATLVDGVVTAGRHTVVWDGHDGAGRAASSGVYFARLVTDEHVRTRKMVMMR